LHHQWQSALEGIVEVLEIPSNMKSCRNEDSSEEYFGVEFKQVLNALTLKRVLCIPLMKGFRPKLLSPILHRDCNTL
jgi:hypothetical protein